MNVGAMRLAACGRIAPVLGLLFCGLLCELGCGHKPEQFVMPDKVTDFTVLFENNCAGCHGASGRDGAARPLNDRLFLALIGTNRLKETIANGVPRTAMPAFAQSSGGSLTGEQVDILAEQMEARWSPPGEPLASTLPPYTSNPGDPKRGEDLFHRVCARCHTGKGIGGSLTDPSFLALVSDQSLRTTIIAGRSDRGMPNWSNQNPGRQLTPEDVSDVVAWVSSHRGISNR